MTLSNENIANSNDTTEPSMEPSKPPSSTGAASASPPPKNNKELDWSTCTPQVLARYLHQLPRFSNAKTTCLDFCQQVTRAVEQLESPSTKKDNTTSSTSESNTQSLGETETLGKSLETAEDTVQQQVSCAVPRCGKVQLQFFERGVMALKQNTNDVVWTLKSSSSLSSTNHETRLWVLPKPQDLKQKKKPHQISYLILLQRTANVALVEFKQKPHDQVSLVVPPSSNENKDQESPRSKNALPGHVETVVERLVTSLGLSKAHVTRITDTKDFGSYQEASTSATGAGLPFVSCFCGVQDGFLYPLRQGLLFVAANLKFRLVCDDMRSVAAGRGSGGSSRYIDVQVQLTNDNESVEFTNVDRTELPGLNKYIHHVLIPSLQQQQQAGDDGNDKNNDDDETDDENDNDEPLAVAVPVDDVTISAAAGNTHSRKRKASQEAQQAIGQTLRARADQDDDDSDAQDSDFGGGEDESMDSEETSSADEDTEDEPDSD